MRYGGCVCGGVGGERMVGVCCSEAREAWGKGPLPGVDKYRWGWGWREEEEERAFCNGLHNSSWNPSIKARQDSIPPLNGALCTGINVTLQPVKSWSHGSGFWREPHLLSSPRPLMQATMTCSLNHHHDVLCKQRQFKENRARTTTALNKIRRLNYDRGRQSPPKLCKICSLFTITSTRTWQSKTAQIEAVIKHPTTVTAVPKDKQCD